MHETYEDRLRRVVRYIHENPAGDLSLDALADVAAMSRFHWHRVFLAMTGETCAAAVRRIRAYRAAHWLIQTDDTLDVIAARSGYDNPRSFSRAFRDVYGVTPSHFRRGGVPGNLSQPKPPGDTRMYNVSTRTQDPLRLATLTHKGAYYEIGKVFQQLAAIMSARNLWSQAQNTVGVYYDDPSMTPEADLNSRAGVIVSPEFEMSSDLEETNLPGGLHAILVLEGPYTGLQAAYDYLYGTWLGQSGHEPDDHPSFEIYLNDPTNTAPADLRTEICVPLKS
ncbi:MAG: AraC family transcriptional regulator [Pseudomonadota bacterium]